MLQLTCHSEPCADENRAPLRFRSSRWYVKDSWLSLIKTVQSATKIRSGWCPGQGRALASSGIIQPKHFVMNDKVSMRRQDAESLLKTGVPVDTLRLPSVFQVRARGVQGLDWGISYLGGIDFAAIRRLVSHTRQIEQLHQGFEGFTSFWALSGPSLLPFSFCPMVSRDTLSLPPSASSGMAPTGHVLKRNRDWH